MFNSKFLKTAALALALGSASVSATTIDLFSDDQAAQTAGVGYSSAVNNTTNGANIIGGERDILITTDANVRVTTEVILGQLVIASNSFGTTDKSFEVDVQWDGDDADGGSELLSTLGLGSQDLSELDGFLVSILESDGVGSFTVNLWDATGQQASIAFGFIAVDDSSPVDFFIDFGLFTGETPLAGFPVEYPVLGGVNPLFDFGQVSAMQILVNGVGNLDLRVDSITAVPAPGSIALMGLALLGLGGLSRRKA